MRKGERSRCRGRRKSNIPPVNPLNLSRCLNEEGPVGEDIQLTEGKRREGKKRTKLRKMSSYDRFTASLHLLSYPLDRDCSILTFRTF